MAHPPARETLDQRLAQVCRLHWSRADALFQALGLYRGQPPLLFALWHRDGLTQTQLAERLGVSAATISRMVQRMERAGFVRRASDPQDERVTRVFLTPEGQAIRAEVEGIFETMDREAFAGLSAEERAVLWDLLGRVRDNLRQAGGQDLAL